MLKGPRRGQVWGTAGLLGQQLIEGLGGPPVLVLAAGAVLLHNPVVLEAEPSSFDAGGEGAGQWSRLPCPQGCLSHPPSLGLQVPVYTMGLGQGLLAGVPHSCEIC